MVHRCLILCFFLSAGTGTRVSGVEHVEYADGGRRVVSGRVLQRTDEGGLLLQTRTGALRTIGPEQISQITHDDEPFLPFDSDDLSEALLAELDDDFDTHVTAHYVICFDTSRAYAEWCGALLERLHRAFTNYWSRRSVDVVEPVFPLPVIVYASADEYRQHAEAELGQGVASVIAYYSFATNRIVMYDLTGSEAVRASRGTRSTSRDINRMLSGPSAGPLVATIVHEATHQIAFNCGLQTRYADAPLWLSEGLAVYFETPDLQSTRGWRGIGNVNRPRLDTFRRNLPRRQEGTLGQIVADDQPFRNSRTGIDSYAEAWAMNYFLIRKYPDRYVAYVKMLAEKPLLLRDSAEQRIADFREHFGQDLKLLEQEFLRYMQRVR